MKILVEALRAVLPQLIRNLKEREASSKTVIHSLVNPLPEKGKTKMIPSETAKT